MLWPQFAKNITLFGTIKMANIVTIKIKSKNDINM